MLFLLTLLYIKADAFTLFNRGRYEIALVNRQVIFTGPSSSAMPYACSPLTVRYVRSYGSRKLCEGSEDTAIWLSLL